MLVIIELLGKNMKNIILIGFILILFFNILTINGLIVKEEIIEKEDPVLQIYKHGHKSYNKCLSINNISIKLDTYKKPKKIKNFENISEFSWKNYENKDWTTSAKHQNVNCGSCWAFSALATLECVIKIREGCAGLNPDLSEQYLLSCLSAAGDCSGGSSIGAFYYILDDSLNGNFYNGVTYESCFPYLADDSIPCVNKCDDWINFLVPIIDFGYWFPDGSDEDRELIKSEIITRGPVTSCIAATAGFWYWGFSHHDENDYYEDIEEIVYTDHIITIIGWKDDTSIGNGGYWICKNSWGEDFGYDGFFNIEYGALNIDAGNNLTYISWVDYDPESFDWPPIAPTINGPSRGKTGEDYEYTFATMDPDGDDEVYYYIDWGDGTQSDWLGPYGSGEEVTASHSWSARGSYEIRVKSKDVNGAESDWSDPLPVRMPKTYENPLWTLIEKLFDWLEQMFGREILPGIPNWG
jgi:hypothetical protein